jgi:hypothetical protein
LLAAGADPNGRAKSDVCWPPLHNALYKADLDSATLLIGAGASLESSCARLEAGMLRPESLDFAVGHGFNLQAVDGQGRNHLHEALGSPLVPRLETIEYLVRAGVPLNARDRAGKTPLAYWGKPRYYEQRWFATWVREHVLGNGEPVRREREARAQISAFLERSGAVL